MDSNSSSPNPIRAELDKKMFARLLVTGPLTRRLDRVAEALNASWRESRK